MSSKIKRAHPDILLRVRSGGEKLSTVRFALSRNLTYRTKGLTRKRIGTIELTDGSSRKTVKTLRMGRKSRSGLATLTTKGSKLNVSMNLRRSPTILIKGLKSFGATKVQIELFGKITRLPETRTAAAAVTASGQASPRRAVTTRTQLTSSAA